MSGDVLDEPSAGGKVIRGSALRAAGYVAGVLAGTAAAALMIRHLGAADWGRYVTVIALVSIVGGLTEAGMSAIGVREYATREGDDRDRLMRNLLGIRVAFTALGIVAALVFAVAAGYEAVLVLGTLLAGLGLFFTTVQQTLAVPLWAHLRLGWVSAFDASRQVAMLGLVGVLVAIGAGLLSFLALPIVVGAGVLLATVPLVRRAVPLVPAFERPEWARVLRISVAYSAASAVGTIYVGITVILTSLLATAEETGFYGVSFRIFTVVAAIPLLFVGSAFAVLARAARDDRERLEYAVQRLLEVALILGTGVALALGVGAPFVIRLVAGGGFEESVPILRIHGAALIGNALAITLGYTLLSLNRHRALLVANLVGIAVTVAVTAALVPGLGGRGAAVATLVGEFLLAGAYAYALFRGREVPISPRIVPKVALAAGAALAAGVLPDIGSLAALLVASAVYFASLLALRALPRELFDAFVGFGRRAGT